MIPKAAILVAFGLIMMIIVWIIRLIDTESTLQMALVQLGISIASLSLFNYGFYIMRS